MVLEKAWLAKLENQSCRAFPFSLNTPVNVLGSLLLGTHHLESLKVSHVLARFLEYQTRIQKKPTEGDN